MQSLQLQLLVSYQLMLYDNESKNTT